MNKLITILVLTFFVLGISVVLFRNEPLFVTPTQEQSIANNIAEQKDQKQMVNLLKNSNATADFERGETYTVFAPTDQAFAKLPKETLTKLGNKKDNLEEIIRIEDNHTVLGNYPTSTFYDGMQLTTVNAEVITINKKGNEWYINNSIKIVGKDIKSNNGVIHSIDTVLLPKN